MSQYTGNGFKLMGTSDETTCECCGKQNLKRTVLVGRLDGGAVVEVLKFGRDCAARATKLRRTGAALEALAANAGRAIADEIRRTPVVCGTTCDTLWVIESVGGGYEVLTVTTIRCARGLRSEVSAWASKEYPNLCINVRIAR